MRIETDDHALVYSGDTGPDRRRWSTLAAGADVFLCEASFVESEINPPQPAPDRRRGRRRRATRAGVGRLLLTHIPAWTDRAEVEADVKTTWDGPLDLVTSDATYEL